MSAESATYRHCWNTVGTVTGNGRLCQAAGAAHTKKPESGCTSFSTLILYDLSTVQDQKLCNSITYSHSATAAYCLRQKIDCKFSSNHWFYIRFEKILIGINTAIKTSQLLSRTIDLQAWNTVFLNCMTFRDRTTLSWICITSVVVEYTAVGHYCSDNFIDPYPGSC